MFYKVSGYDVRIKNPLVLDNADLKGRNEWWEYAHGSTVEDWDESNWFKVTKKKNEGKLQDVLPNHLGLHVFSERLRAALEQHSIKGIQYLPIRVFRYSGEEVPGYAIVNFLHLVPGLDLKESRYDVYPEDYFLPERRGQVASVMKYVLRSSVVSLFDAFRLKENTVAIIVSEKFKRLFETNSFTGYTFDEVKVVDS